MLYCVVQKSYCSVHVLQFRKIVLHAHVFLLHSLCLKAANFPPDVSCVAGIQLDARANPAGSSVLTAAAAFQQDGSVMETTTVETCLMNRTAVSSLYACRQ